VLEKKAKVRSISTRSPRATDRFSWLQYLENEMGTAQGCVVVARSDAEPADAFILQVPTRHPPRAREDPVVTADPRPPHVHYCLVSPLYPATRPRIPRASPLTLAISIH
jgi:hypothetical protein